MKKSFFIITVLLITSFKAFAQSPYFDLVEDKKTIAAMNKEHIRKITRLSSWMSDEETIAYNQKEIARKVTFIEMVRDSLYKSLQDVGGIIDANDQKLINQLCYDIELYQLKIDSMAKVNSLYEDVRKECKQKLVKRADDLLNVTDMAVAGNDETNLINKEQRLNLLNYILTELRGLRKTSVDTFAILPTTQTTIKSREYASNRKIDITSIE